MATIENIKGTIAKASKTAVKKTKDIAGMAKLTTEIEETRKLIREVHIEIGKKYCELYDENTAEADFAVSVATVQNLTERLEALRKERLALRGLKMCDNCKKGSKEAFEFCPYCGTKFPEKAEEDVTEGDPETDVDLTDDAGDEGTEE